MEHRVMAIDSQDQFDADLAALATTLPPDHQLLVMLMTSRPDDHWLSNLHQQARHHFDSAVIVSFNTPGNIGSSLNCHHTQASILVFEASSLYASMATLTAGNEQLEGENLARQLPRHISTPTTATTTRQTTTPGTSPDAGLSVEERPLVATILLTTPLVSDVSSLINGFCGSLDEVPIAGGGIGCCDISSPACLMLNEYQCHQGAIAIGLYSNVLRVQSSSYLGWTAFGDSLTVTEAENNRVKEINHTSAADLYDHFIGFDKDDFFNHAMEFPFVLERDGHRLARVPIKIEPDHSMQFVADIQNGDQLQFAYADIGSILTNIDQCKADLQQFEPESILLFSCISRQIYLQEHAPLEVSPYASVAPTAGFFTYGEIDTTNYGKHQLNATIVGLGLSEKRASASNQPTTGPEQPGLASSRDLSRMKRLMHFISRMTDQLQQANTELRALSEKDPLTGIANRRTLMDELSQQLHRQQSQQAASDKEPTGLALVMIDIDHFKAINDLYGHQRGDDILISVTRILQQHIDASTLLARYGGEEFALLIPDTSLQGAAKVAERLRNKIATRRIAFSEDNLQESHLQEVLEITLTCSFGVALAKSSDSETTLINRADTALYKAKTAGRNLVVW